MDSQKLIQWLIERHQEAKLKNPRTSLRILAKRIGIHNSTLSRILRGKQVMSQRTCLQIKNFQNFEMNSKGPKPMNVQMFDSMAQVVEKQL